MRRKHYAIGAAILTAGVAAVVLMPKDQQTGFARLAYLPSDMLSPFSAPPAIPLPAVDAPAAHEAPAVVAEIPASTPIDVPPANQPRIAAQPLPEIPVASAAPSDTPFVWHGSGGRGQSWTGTGGRSAALNGGTSSFGGSGGGGGGGAGGGVGGSTHPLAEAPSLPPSSSQPPARPMGPAFGRGGDDNNAASAINSLSLNGGGGGAGGGAGGGGGGFTKGGTAASIVAPGGPNDGNQGFLSGPAQFASYEAPEGDEPRLENGEQLVLTAVTVDEPGALSILLVSALGLLAARRATKRGVV